MARRVARERNVELGKEVGYAIRFDDRSCEDTRIKYVTDGVALREVLGSGGFDRYDVVMIDEAHERALNTDMLLALAKGALKKGAGGKKLRLVISSATLDVDHFAKYFNNAPVFRITGAVFPVDIVYTPVIFGSSRGRNDSQDGGKRSHNRSSTAANTVLPSPNQIVDAAVGAALKLHLSGASLAKEGATTETLGGILVFLTGQAECLSACTLLMQRLSEAAETQEVDDAVVLPLYGALPSEDQNLVFEPVPERCRKIVFSTNVAETSLTLAGVEFVIDCGFVKQKLCNVKTGVEILTLVRVAKSQAVQRAGRAGRCSAGRCYRLYSEEEFDDFQDSPDLEIHRTTLDSVVLQLKSLGISDVTAVEFLDPPLPEAVLASTKHLLLLGALNKDNLQITDLGRRMVALPLSPMYARCLLAAWAKGVAREVAAVVAILSVDSFWQRPSENSRRDEAESMLEVHRRFFHPSGDHLTMLNVFLQYMDQSRREQGRWALRHYLHLRPLNQAVDIYNQLCKSFLDSSTPKLGWRAGLQGAREARVDQKRRKRHTHRETYHDGGRYSYEAERGGRGPRHEQSRGRRGERDARSDSWSSTSESMERRRKTQRRSRSCSCEPKDDRQASIEEQILKSLCEAFFLNAAKLSASCMTATVWSESSPMAVWITLRDGLLARIENNSSLVRQSGVIPEYIIFSELIGSPQSGKSTGTAIGVMRGVSVVKAEWLMPLIARFRTVSLRSLASVGRQKGQGDSLAEGLAKARLIEDPIQTQQHDETQQAKV